MAEADSIVVFEVDGGRTVVMVSLTGSGNNSDIIGMRMISITRIDGNIIIVNNSINQTSTRLERENISTFGIGIGAGLGLILGTKIGIDLGERVGAALGLALGLVLGSGLGSLFGIGFDASI